MMRKKRRGGGDGVQHGFAGRPHLDQSDPVQRHRIDHLLSTSDFLFLPTRADCTPVAFSEASAFGLPVVSTQVGGVAEMVCDGITGALLPMDAGPRDYAEVIRTLYQDASRYKALRLASRQWYEQRLNWDAWARDVVPILEELSDRRRGPTARS